MNISGIKKEYHALYGYEILNFCTVNDIPLEGIYMKGDKVPYVVDKFYLLNLDERTGGGTHWVVGYIGEDVCCYLDPFGIHPDLWIYDWLKQKNKKLLISTNQLQDVKSLSCGYICCLVMYLAHHMGGGMYSKLDYITREIFNPTDVDANETMIRKLFNNMS